MVIVPGLEPSPAGEASATWPRILVVDAQPLFVAALGHLLSGSTLRARTLRAEGSADALELLEEEAVDLVLCDVRIHPKPFREFLRELERLPDPPPVVLLGDVHDEDLLVAAIDTTAAGFFTKDMEPAQFLDGVRAVLAGHRAVGANVMQVLMAKLSGHDGAGARSGLSQLSRTELDILTMVGGASSVQAIAAARGISQKTVRNHLANIYRKLDLRSRTEAMLCAARMGLTSD